MKTNQKKQIFGWLRILLAVLIAVMALSAVSCGDSKATETEAEAEGGSKTFTFEVVPIEGESKTFTITTTRKTVGEALLDEKLIEGETGDYGLYVKKVNGITADYSVDGTYWAFYINGEYGMTGVDMTDVEDGGTYAFKQEK